MQPRNFFESSGAPGSVRDVIVEQISLSCAIATARYFIQASSRSASSKKAEQNIFPHEKTNTCTVRGGRGAFAIIAVGPISSENMGIEHLS